MSASLVGSEMCIRDSLTPGCLRPSVRSSGTMCAWHRCSPLLPTLCLAVSYTHLTLPTICSV
eukprot:4980588-Alexandrium_andersonii.AAC.1